MATINNIKAQENDISHYRGDVFDEVWTITKDDESAYDLSGKTLVLSIKEKKTYTTAAETLTTTDGEIAISGASNNVLTFDKVVELDERGYYYDLEIVDDNYTISYGQWKEVYDVNR